MKTAAELNKISKSKAPEIVADILDGVKEHVVQRCEEEANKGAMQYSIYLKEGLLYIEDLLLEECIKLAKEFENNGYEVSIEDDGNEYYVDFIITFSWGEYDNNRFDHGKILYTTKSGIINDTSFGNEENS